MRIAPSGIAGLLGADAADRDGFREGRSFILKGGSSSLMLQEARQLTALLNCREADASRRPCGLCLACRQIETDTYPYWFVVAPGGDANQIKVNQVRELQAMLGSKAVEDQFQVAVFVDAHRMNEQAQNRLLKTLEEPPEDTLLLLLTDSPRELLPTVRSRCRILDFREEAPAPDQKEQDMVLDVLRAIQDDAYLGVFEKAAFVAGSRKGSLPAFFYAMEYLLRSALLQSMTTAKDDAYGIRAGLTQGAPSGLIASSRNYLTALRQVWRAGYLLERNVNALLLLEDLFLHLKGLSIRVAEGGSKD